MADMKTAAYVSNQLGISCFILIIHGSVHQVSVYMQEEIHV